MEIGKLVGNLGVQRCQGLFTVLDLGEGGIRRGGSHLLIKFDQLGIETLVTSSDTQLSRSELV